MILVIRSTPEPFRSIDAIIALRKQGEIPLALAKDAIDRAISRNGDVRVAIHSAAALDALVALGVDCFIENEETV